MKSLHVQALAIAVVSFCALSCGTSSKAYGDEEDELTDEEYEQVTAGALADAAIAVEAPEESMEREGAILALRAKEHRLRANGYNAAADRYIEVCDSVLRASEIIFR